MEGNKNAMYAQVGKTRGWTQGIAEETAIKAVPVPVKEEKSVIANKTVVTETIVSQETHAAPKAPVMIEKAVVAENVVMAEIPVMAERPVMAEKAVVVEKKIIAEKPIAPVMPVIPVMPDIPAPPVVVVAPETGKTEEECQTYVMAYVKMQKWHELYESEQGFSRGTMFAGLDLPFVGEGACSRE